MYIVVDNFVSFYFLKEKKIYVCVVHKTMVSAKEAIFLAVNCHRRD